MIVPLFEFDEERGILKDKITGERCLIVSETRMQEMFSKLVKIFSSGATVICFEMNKATGKHLYDGSPKKLQDNTKLFIKTFAKRLMESGIGKIELLDLNEKEGKTRIRIYDNFYAKIQHEDLIACSNVEDILAGLFERIFQKTPKFQKLKCIGKGDPYCEWTISPK